MSFVVIAVAIALSAIDTARIAVTHSATAQQTQTAVAGDVERAQLDSHNTLLNAYDVQDLSLIHI